MPYVVRKTNGEVQVIVNDDQINTDLGVTLVGRGRQDYGEAFAENFIRLIENFANDTAPINPLDGQLWFDTSVKKFKFWSNNTWTAVADKGSIGYTGSRGPMGLQGIEGEIGYTGSRGSMGYTGSVGATGPAGESGPASTVAGPIGYTGSRGATGPASTVPGPLGYTGSRGSPGVQGIQGYVGSKGSIGLTGADGPRGVTGYTGSVGATGPGLGGNFNFNGQTISGTVLNQNITINPLGTGKVSINSDVLPSADATYNLGSSSNNFAKVYAGGITGSRVPTSSKGSAGDTAGLIAFDGSYFYYCNGTYNGTTDIWRRVPWGGVTW